MSVTLTAQTMLAPFASTSGSPGYHDFTFSASSSSGNDWLTTGRDALLAYNSGSAGGTITVTSYADEKNRTSDISVYALAAGDFASFGVGLTNSKGWQDAAKLIHLATSGDDVKLAVLRLPDGYPS